MTKTLAVLLASTCLCGAPALALTHPMGDLAPAPSYEECVAEWTAFFGTDSQYDDATRAMAMDGLSPDDRARMEVCDQMLDGGRALETGQ